MIPFRPGPEAGPDLVANIYSRYWCWARCLGMLETAAKQDLGLGSRPVPRALLAARPPWESHVSGLRPEVRIDSAAKWGDPPPKQLQLGLTPARPRPRNRTDDVGSSGTGCS